MRFRKTILLLLFSLNFFIPISNQAQKKIKFGKSNSTLYFFQKGAKSDTILKDRSDVFYLVVPDSMKSMISVTVENGRLQSTSNDSLVRFESMPGLQYESVYLSPPLDTGAPPLSIEAQKSKSNFEFKTRINGSSDKEKTKVIIKIADKKRDKIILENVFYFSD